MLSAHHVAVTRQLLAAAGIAVRWSAPEELRPERVVRLPAARPGGRSVVVKVASGEDQDPRTGRRALRCEWAALALFEQLGTTATPRLLAVDPAAGVLVLEDLGDGPSLATLLLGDDPAAAGQAAERSAASLGALHAASIGSSGRFSALHRQLDPTWEPLRDRWLLRGLPIREGILELPGLLSGHGLPPLPRTGGVELDDVVDTLGDPGPFLVLSNGDPCPDNERVVPGGSRFFDFEAAAYRHALLDAAHYRIPFPNCWCWRRLPPEVGRRMESAYRTSLAAGCAAALDDAVYEPAMVRMAAAWLVWMLHRRLAEAATDERSGQRIVSCLSELSDREVAHTVTPGLARWADEMLAALGRRWPRCNRPAPTYPAFGGPPFPWPSG